MSTRVCHVVRTTRLWSDWMGRVRSMTCRAGEGDRSWNDRGVRDSLRSFRVGDEFGGGVVFVERE